MLCLSFLFYFFLINLFFYLKEYIAGGDWLGIAGMESQSEWTNPMQSFVQPGRDPNRVLRERLSPAVHLWCCLHSEL